MKRLPGAAQRGFRGSVVLLGVLILGGSCRMLQGEEIVQVAADSSGQSSLVDGTNWSDGLAPSAGNDYVTGRAIRTPVSSSDVIFAGDSLTLNNGGSMLFKGLGTTVTITINNLHMDGTTAFVTNYQGSATSFTLAGNIVLGTGVDHNFLLNNAGSGGGFVVASAISGDGAFGVYSNGGSLSTVAVSLTGANNTYTGGTIVYDNARLLVGADKALGLGDVTVTHGALTLELGSTHDYIADSASLILSTGLADSAINLNFAGMDAIGGLSLDGGATYLSVGTYDAAELNSLYGSNAFIGAGQLNVVPEPAVAWLMGVALTGWAVRRRSMPRS